MHNKPDHLINAYEKEIEKKSLFMVRMISFLAVITATFMIITGFYHENTWTNVELHYFRLLDLMFFVVSLILFIISLFRNIIGRRKHICLLKYLLISTIILYSALISSIEQIQFLHHPTLVICSLLISILLFVNAMYLMIMFIISVVIIHTSPLIPVHGGDSHIYYTFIYIALPLIWITSNIMNINYKKNFINRYYLSHSKKDLEKQVKERTAELSEANAKLKNEIEVQKRYELMLKNAKQQAVESDRLKSAFLANMSHEIRTPMNGIMGFSELLDSENLPPEKKRQYIEIIKGRCKDLMEIIDNILDISLIEAGIIDIKKEEFSLNELFNEVYLFEGNKKNHLKKEHIKMGLKIPVNDIKITTDKLKLKQVLDNLLDNAIKFTFKGEINFGYASSGPSNIEIFIKDTGIGIEKQKREMIFERFYQTDHGLNRQFEGIGLGLAIVKNFVDLLDGSIRLESVPGKGSAFYITLPV